MKKVAIKKPEVVGEADSSAEVKNRSKKSYKKKAKPEDLKLTEDVASKLAQEAQSQLQETIVSSLVAQEENSVLSDQASDLDSGYEDSLDSSSKNQKTTPELDSHKKTWHHRPRSVEHGGQLKRRELPSEGNGYQNRRHFDNNPKGQSEGFYANPQSTPQAADASESSGLDASGERRIFDVLILNRMSVEELIDFAIKLGISEAGYLGRQELVFKILDFKSRRGFEIIGEGVLERLSEGYGFLRSSFFNYLPGSGDIYVPPAYIKRFGLRTGDQIKGLLRRPKEGERFFALGQVDFINGVPTTKAIRKTIFENLVPIFPNKKFSVESGHPYKSVRIMDLFAPIGFGQRGLIVAPPKTGKTMLLKDLANSILKNNAGLEMIVLLIDERPEEVTDFQRSITGAEVISSTFDEHPARHIQVAEMVLEKARRMVECGKHVVIILDSLTRLARAYNTMTPSSGKVLSGGVEATALSRPKRFFGSARNIENYGSLTIIASVLVETGSKMDDVIYEEFKGTGNMEVHLTRKLSNKRIYPAIDVHTSSTRRDDLLVSEEVLNNMWILQKFLSSMNTIESMEFMLEKIVKTETNKDFWDLMSQGRQKTS